MVPGTLRLAGATRFDAGVNHPFLRPARFHEHSTSRPVLHRQKWNNSKEERGEKYTWNGVCISLTLQEF